VIVKLVQSGYDTEGVSWTVNSRILFDLGAIAEPEALNCEAAKCALPHPDDPARKVTSQALNVACTPADSATETRRV
jgi:hypothetical protein